VRDFSSVQPPVPTATLLVREERKETPRIQTADGGINRVNSPKDFVSEALLD
jgi:hypothetical protein